MAEPNSDRSYWNVSGLIILSLGVLAVIFPLLTGISLSFLFGSLLLAGGVVHVAQVFSVSGWKSSILQLALGTLYLLGGIAIVSNPVLGLATLTMLLLFYLMLSGLVEIFWGLRVREQEYSFGIVLSGLLSLLLAVLIWFQWPASAAWALGLLFGLSLISTGASMMFYGLKGESAS